MRVRGLGLISALVMPIAVLGLCGPGMAQQVSYALLQPGTVPTGVQPVQPAQPSTLQGAIETHRFWDTENSILFAATAALNTADFVATRDNLRSGGHELNPITRVFSGSTPTLAMNFAGETAGVVGLSYFFHRTGHHKLERATSMLSISTSAVAVTFDLTHR
jgi:hypothetical protein